MEIKKQQEKWNKIIVINRIIKYFALEKQNLHDLVNQVLREEGLI